MEALRRREEGVGTAKAEAEAAREQAEMKMESALLELSKRNSEREVCFGGYFMCFTQPKCYAALPGLKRR